VIPAAADLKVSRAALAAGCGAAVVQSIGHVVALYRPVAGAGADRAAARIQTRVIHLWADDASIKAHIPPAMHGIGDAHALSRREIGGMQYLFAHLT